MSLAILGLALHGCEKECKPGSACDMQKVCNDCCDDDPWDPDARCASETSVPTPMGEVENKICHKWCDTKCPRANDTHSGACVTPAREAAQVSTNRFGKAHEDRVINVKLRGRKAGGNVSMSGCMWRQTGACNPNGEREAKGDKPCDALIEPGLSGFCECQGKDQFGNAIENRGYETACGGKFAFVCELACGEMDMCAWRQTGGCDPEGGREPANDKPCGTFVAAGASGYCECGSDKRRTRKTTCEGGKERFSCLEACSDILLEDSEKEEDGSEAEGEAVAEDADPPEL